MGHPNKMVTNYENFPGVGKTTLITRYEEKSFNPRTSATVGVAYSQLILKAHGYKVVLQVIIKLLSDFSDRKGSSQYPPPTSADMNFSRLEYSVRILQLCVRFALLKWQADRNK